MLKKIRFIQFILLCFFIYVPSAYSAEYCPTQHPRFISYTEAGSGKPLVLIHAFPSDQQLWAPQQAELANYFRVITPDLWGFGRSAATDGKAVTMTDYADEIKQLLDRLQIKKAIIGGESMGGYITLAFLKKYPERVAGIVLSNTQSIADNPDIKTKREATATHILTHGTAPFISGFMTKALSSTTSPSKQTFLLKILVAQKPTALASALRGMALRDDTSTVLAHTTLPALIITGSQDTLIAPQQSQSMHMLAKNSRLVMIAGAGHLSSLEQPSAWNKAIVDMFYIPKKK